MPTIPTIVDNTPPAEPSNLGTQAYISAARRVGPLERESGELIAQGIATAAKDIGGIFQQREEDASRQEIMQGHVALARMQAAQTDLWTQTANSVDPNNVGAAAADFHENVLNPQGQQFLDSFHTAAGKKWAEEALGTYGASMATRLNNDAKTANADAAVVGVNQSMNVLSNTVYKDPTTLDNSLGLWDSQINHLASGVTDPKARAKLDTELRQKGRNEIVLSALKGAIEHDPDNGRQILQSQKYAQDITGAQAHTLDTYAETLTRTRAAQQKADIVEGDRIAKQAFGQEMTSTTANLINPDGSLRAPSGDYYQNILRASQMPGADRATVEAAINFGHTLTNNLANGTPTITDPMVKMDFGQRMFRSPDDPTRLTDAQVFTAFNQGKLSQKDFTFFHQAVDVATKNPQLAEDQKEFDRAVRGYEGYIDRSTLTGKDAYGMQKYAEFYGDKQAQFITGRNAGVSVNDLLRNPTSPSYLFKNDDVARYQPTMKQRQQELTSGVKAPLVPLPRTTPAIAPWKPGESMDDLAKRIQGGK